MASINLFRTTDEEEDKSFDDVIHWYSRLHCLVVGPGLGREEHMMRLVKVL